MKKKSTSRAKTTIKEATTKATEAVKCINDACGNGGSFRCRMRK